MSTLLSDGKPVTDSFENTELLNNQFHSVFTNQNLSDILNTDHPSYPTMLDISFSNDGIFKLLSELDISKFPGPGLAKKHLSYIPGLLQSI